MKRIIAVSNRKGGSGKTTTAVNLSAALALRKHKVLIIDTDPQAHTTLSLGFTPKDFRHDICSVLEEGKKPEQVMIDTSIETLKLVASGKKLTGYESKYSRVKGARMRLAESLKGMDGEFDYIIIDTPPTLSLMTVSALAAANEVVVPMQTHFLSLEGLAEMVRLISQINRLYNPELRLKGVVPTFYKERTLLSRAIIDEVKKNLGEGVILHPVRVNIQLAEAPGHGKSIFQYSLKSNGAYDYLAVAKQIEGMK